ncbi:MAG TPA: uroporphyrinogen-III synthase [Ktedonobacteraceae bacterium]|nr:uroporphyrinogen-III synthase [Ktedonobacteraceae bacterium]
MFESQVQALPLQGKRILVTRTREQASTFSQRLKALGALPVEFPTIRIVPPQDWEQLDSALNKLFLENAQERRYYDWLVFTSVNGVAICCERLIALGHTTEHMSHVRIAAIGPATAAALKHYGLTADVVPDEYIAEGVATALRNDAQARNVSLAGQRVLLARAAGARKILVTELQQAGALVDEVPAYYTGAVAHDDEQGQHVLRLLREQQLDILTFTSSSTVRNFMQWLSSDEERVQLVTRNPHLTIACIGPITAQTARESGLNVAIEAQEFTIDGLVEAIVQHVHSVHDKELLS